MQETVTYLEMTALSDLVPAAHLPGLALERITTGSPMIRDLTVRIGRAYGWRSAAWNGEQWAEYLATPNIQAWLIRHGEEPAGLARYQYGLAEFQARPGDEVEITTFGLVPELVGKGIGGPALTLALRKAWELVPDVRRVWLHTSSLDHPGALPNYRKRGLREFRTETREREP